MREDDENELTPSAFDGMTLSPEERAKIDKLRDDWKREGQKAMRAFEAAEPSLCLRAIERVVGPEMIREALIEVMEEKGITLADLTALRERKLN